MRGALRVLLMMLICLGVLPGRDVRAQNPVKLVKTRVVENNFFPISGGGTGEIPYDFAPPISNGDVFLKTWDKEIHRMRDGVTTPILVENDPRVPAISVLLSLYVFDAVIVFVLGQDLWDNLSDRRGAAQRADEACSWFPLRRLGQQALQASLCWLHSLKNGLHGCLLLLALPVVAAFVRIIAGGNRKIVAFTLALAHAGLL